MRVAHSAVAMLVRLIAGARPIVDAGYSPRAATDGAPGAHAATVLDLPPQALYYANHSSHLDFAVIWSVLPGRLRRRARPVAAADYWGSGWKARSTAALFRPVLVRRGRGDAPAAAPTRDAGAEPAPVRGLHGQLATLGAVLAEGDSLILFPEGTRGDGDGLAEFQAGVARLAAAFPEVPVVPVALGHLGRILPKGGAVPVPMLGTAEFLPPLPRGADEPERAYLERARAVLEAALPDPEAEAAAELDEGASAAERPGAGPPAAFRPPADPAPPAGPVPPPRGAPA